MDKHIVMDNVSGPANKSNKFGSFLSVCWKFRYSCIYIFHIIYPKKTIWQMIISQTKSFNIFLGSVQLSSVLKIKTNNCNRETLSRPETSGWIDFILKFQTEMKKSTSQLIVEIRISLHQKSIEQMLKIQLHNSAISINRKNIRFSLRF